MKKQVIALLLTVTMVVTAAGCGASGNDGTDSTSTESTATESESTETGGTENANGSESTEDTEASAGGISSVQMNVDPAEHVTSLCDYSNIPISILSYYEMSDENINEATEELLSGYNLNTKEITDRTIVEEGDYVNVDYTGYQDGEAFSGGSATDVLLDVSNNMTFGGTSSFIDGFCDGLIGAEVGSTIDCDVTFPEDYGVDSLNGQTVVFEFVINGIYAKASLDEIEDSAIEEAFGDSYGITSMDTMKQFVEQYIESSRYSAIVNAVEDYMLENCTVDIPEEYLSARLSEFEDTYADRYCTDGQTLEEYFQTTYSMELSEAEEQFRDYVEEQISIEFIFDVIADQVGIEMDEDEYSAYVQNFITNNSTLNFSTEDDVYSYYGAGSIEDGMEYLRNLYLVNKAIDYVAENAEVTYTES